MIAYSAPCNFFGSVFFFRRMKMWSILHSILKSKTLLKIYEIYWTTQIKLTLTKILLFEMVQMANIRTIGIQF